MAGPGAGFAATLHGRSRVHAYQAGRSTTCVRDSSKERYRAFHDTYGLAAITQTSLALGVDFGGRKEKSVHSPDWTSTAS
ncbi:hypothetical protein HaLaN_15934, partial [Haematococcus lacustris]